MNVTVICVGKLKERFWAEAQGEYVKRLSSFCKLQIVELSEERLPADPSPALIQNALRKEAEAIRAKIPPRSHVVAMCVEGVLRSSEALADTLRGGAWGGDSAAKGVVFLLGGSFGLDEALKAEADERLSMSPMTFPHHLARVMVLEQLYRAFQILRGSPYHK